MIRLQQVPTVPALVAFLVLSGCSPSISPLFRDFEYRTASTGQRDLEPVRTALETAGWKTIGADAPGVVATDLRTVAHWGLYKVVVQLEAVPFGDHYVRVLIHPYRQYITGGRSKIPYLSRNLRHSIVPDLSRALEQQGLAMVGTPMERDKIASNPGY